MSSVPRQCLSLQITTDIPYYDTGRDMISSFIVDREGKVHDIIECDGILMPIIGISSEESFDELYEKETELFGKLLEHACKNDLEEVCGISYFEDCQILIPEIYKDREDDILFLESNNVQITFTPYDCIYTMPMPNYFGVMHITEDSATIGSENKKPEVYYSYLGMAIMDTRNVKKVMIGEFLQ